MAPDPTASSTRETQLKHGLHRSVLLRTTSTEKPTVVKRFHSRGPWRRLLDGVRARREHQMLSSLHELGLRVPKPLACARRGGVWELSVEAIPGARSLSEFLCPLSRLPRDAAALAREAGRLLGHAHALGLDHGDLHGGNLLFDGEGQAWLVDVPRARLRSLPTAVIERDLLVLNSDAREFVGARLRQRFWLAWQRSFRSHGGVLHGDLQRIGARAEAHGARRRREVLMQHADRWLRPSGLCHERSHAGQTVLAARHALAQAWFAREHFDAIIDHDHDRVQANWQVLGRAWQHGLPSLIPLYLHQGLRPTAAYLLPASAEALGHELSQDGWPLAQALTHRELALSSESRPWVTEEGQSLIGPGCRLVAVGDDAHG